MIILLKFAPLLIFFGLGSYNFCMSLHFCEKAHYCVEQIRMLEKRLARKKLKLTRRDVEPLVEN